MGGDKNIPFKRMMDEKPDEIIRLAVRRMLPKSTLGRHILLNLKIYAGDAHPHEAQQPQALPLPAKKSK
jgi:large subunit ribosomal protein L13